MTVKIRSIIPAIIANRNAYTNSQEYERSMEKISSGLEIVRAADGPSSLTISEQMRAQITGLNQALDNSEVAVSLMKTTEVALAEVNRMLKELRQLAVHASNEAVNDPFMLEADQQEVDNIVNAINRIAAQTVFGTKPILNGINSSLGITTGKDLRFLAAGEKTTPSPEDGYDVVIAQEATRGNVLTELLNTKEFEEDMELTVQSATNATKIKLEPGQNLSSVVNRINQNFIKYNVAVEALYKEGPETTITNEKGEKEQKPAEPTVGRILFRNTEFGSEPKFNIGFNRKDVIFGVNAYDVHLVNNGKDVTGTIDGESTIGKGQILQGVPGAKTQGVKILYKGENPIQEPTRVGSLIIRQNAMRFQLGGNFGETKSIDVNSIYAKDLAENVENESEFRSLQEIDVTTFEKAQDTLRLIEKATNEISSLRGDLGAFQKNNLESNIDAVSIASESMTNSESVIRDANIAEKYVDLTKYQLMKDAALSMVSHSKQSVQKAMQLINPS